MEGPNATEIQALRQALFVDKRRVTFVTGAGISVKSGIPLYRSDKKLGVTDAVEAKPSQKTDETPKTAPEMHAAAEFDDDVRVVISDDEEFGESFSHIATAATAPGLIEVDQKPVIDTSMHERMEPDSSGSNLTTSEVINGKMVDEKLSEREAETNITQHLERKAIWDAKLELLATREAFLIDPRNWYARFWFDTHHVDGFLTASPNESHLAIANICNNPSLRATCITQNVDNLHRKAGIQIAKLIEIHGRIGIYRCTDPNCSNYSEGVLAADDLEFLTVEEERYYYEELETLTLPLRPHLMETKAICSHLYAQDEKSGKPDYMRDKRLPCCPLCRAPVIPITLLFDEAYTTHSAFQFTKALEWIQESDVIVFCGTSFSVYFTEETTRLARELNKEVFNLNIRMDLGQFRGFHTTRNLPPLISTSIGTDKKIILNFDSDPESNTKDSDDNLLDDDNDSPLFSNSSPSSLGSATNIKMDSATIKMDSSSDFIFPSRKSVYKHKSDFPVIHHVVGPADELLMQILPKQDLDEVNHKFRKIKRSIERRCWDIPSTVIPLDDPIVLS